MLQSNQMSKFKHENKLEPSGFHIPMCTAEAEAWLSSSD